MKRSRWNPWKALKNLTLLMALIVVVLSTAWAVGRAMDHEIAQREATYHNWLSDYNYHRAINP